MSRYFTRPRASERPLAADRSWVEDHIFDSERPMLPAISVSDHEPICTGLLDASGDDIWRAPLPVGFGRDDEW